MRPYRGMTKEGKWVYGNYCNLAGLAFIAEYPNGAGFDKGIKTITGWVEVLRSTVGQSTGECELYDEKVEIWKDDIIEFSYEYGFIGALQTKEISEPVVFRNGQYWVGEYSLQRAIDENGHVIGNIHENPELLKD